jgi:outer membrane receptor protein involved in Fe transport
LKAFLVVFRLIIAGLTNHVMKNNTKRIFFLLIYFFCLNCSNSFSQNPAGFLLKGTIIDSISRKPIELATISILDAAKKVVALTYSDEGGVFKSSDVVAGSFFLNLSFVGYQQKTIAFQINSQNAYEFGVIYLKPDVTQLQAVTISGNRQLVEQQPGMLIYNAEKDISNQGGTAADVLRKAPILNVDAAGNVTMRGNSNLRILINGKYSGQTARNPADALNMMPAGSIKSVEVITSPSARYDAEGAAGVINIITKKGNQSTSGTVEIVAGNLEQAINPRISANRDKWNIGSTLHLHRFRNKELLDLNRTTLENGLETGKIRQEVAKDNAKPHSSGDLQIEYARDSVNTFNFSLNGWLGRWPENTEQHNRQFSPSGTLLEEYFQSVKTKAPNKGFDMNLGYAKKFRKPGEELYLLAQHNRSVDDYNYNASQKDNEQFLTYREINNNRTSNQEWTFQADYILPFSASGKHVLESGAKAILRNVSSLYDFSASESGQPDLLIPVSARSDQFDYRQDVLAAYSQVKFKWNNGWALHAGARMEGTFLEGKQLHISTDFTSRFWNFVPSATIFKKLNSNNNLTLSYTKRISRPSIWDLNPNKDTQNPNNIVIGNPTLRPEEVNQVEFTYALQTNGDLFVNLSLFARKTNNSIESIVTIDTAGIATTTKQNLASNGQYGLNFSTSFSILPGWKVNSNANVRYAKFKSGALKISNDGAAWGLNVNSSWKLPNNYSVQIYGNYDARSVTLQGYQTYWLYYSLSAKKELPARKLTFTLTAVSPFSSYISQSEIVRSTDFVSSQRTQYLSRSVRLSINWEFGGLFKGVQTKKISNDDLKNMKQGG